MPIPLVAIVWDGLSRFLWIEESNYDPDIHQLYIEPDDEVPPTPPSAESNSDESIITIADERSGLDSIEIAVPKNTRKKSPVNAEESKSI